MESASSHLDLDPAAPPPQIAMPFDGSVATNDAGGDPTGEEWENKLEPLIAGHVMCINSVKKVYKIGGPR